MADTYEAERARRLAIIIEAEREIEAEVRVQYAALLAAIADDVFHGKPPIVAAQDQQPADPAQNRNQINALWLVLGAIVAAKIAGLFKLRFMGSGAPRARLKAAQDKFVSKVTGRLASVPNEVYVDLDRIRDTAMRAGKTAAEITSMFEDELLPGHSAYEARLDTVASRVARTSATAAFNAGDQEGFIAISEHDRVPMATKRWLSSHDTKVRPTHVEADASPLNQNIPADAFFQVGGFPALYPGDDMLPPEESVNCRCTALYFENGSLVASLATNGAPVTTPETTLPDGFRGPIAALDVPTGDRRQLCTPEEGVRTREYPLSLTMNHVGDPTGYPVIGHLDRVWAQDGLLYGEGPFDLGGEAGMEAARQLHEGHMNTVSVDPDMVIAAVNTYDAEGNLLGSEQLSATEAEHFRLAKGVFEIAQLRTLRGQLCAEEPMEDTNTYVLAFTDWRLAGLAMVPIPAYTQARIEPVYGYKPSKPGTTDAIVSAVGGQIFTSKFFGDPKLAGPTPLTIDEDGHVYGHVRLHGTCYQYGNGAGNGGFCLEPPPSANGYAKFKQHGAKMDDGSIRRVGALTYGDGHLSAGSMKASIKHYNDVATVAAKVEAGSDDFGVWINGEVLDSHRDKAYDLLLSPLSGHWEPDADNNGYLEMMAAHIIVTPAYSVQPVVAGFDADHNVTSLIVTTAPTAPIVSTAVPAVQTTPISAVVAAMKQLRRVDELAEQIRKGTEDARQRRIERIRERLAAQR